MPLNNFIKKTAGGVALREVSDQELTELADDVGYDCSEWPLGDDIPENMKEVTSMSRFMEHVKSNCTKNKVGENQMQAFCCIGSGVDTRNDEVVPHVTVWAPHALSRQQKVWSVSALNDFMSREPETFPFFFTVKEILTSKGKPFFQTRCTAVPERIAKAFPAHVQKTINDYKTEQGLVAASVGVKRQRHM